MLIAVIGSRKYQQLNDIARVIRVLQHYFPDVTIISGGAEGVDEIAENTADLVGLKKEIYHPEPKGPGRPAYVKAIWERNNKIAQRCTHMIAFWDGESPGTKGTWEIAAALGKQVTIFHPSGYTILNK